MYEKFIDKQLAIQEAASIRLVNENNFLGRQAPVSGHSDICFYPLPQRPYLRKLLNLTTRHAVYSVTACWTYLDDAPY
jgi:hypothetical protein